MKIECHNSWGNYGISHVRTNSSVYNKKHTLQKIGLPGLRGTSPFFIAYFSFHSGRSPPSGLDLRKEIKIGGLNMEGKYPKRKRDKYNPYTIYEKDGHDFLAFKDGQAVPHTLEISRELYEVFNSFELEDVRYMNVLSRHLEHSEVWENTLNVRAMEQPENVEDMVLGQLQKEELHRAIRSLPEKQRRRLIMYYFDEMTYEQIAAREGCTKMPIKRSIFFLLRYF